MKFFVLGMALLLISAAGLAQTPPGTAAPPATPGTSSGAKPPSGGDAAQQASAPKGPSCRKPGLGTCKGCSITCAEGQKAVCSDGLYNWNSDMCTRDASCRCRAPRF